MQKEVIVLLLALILAVMAFIFVFINENKDEREYTCYKNKAKKEGKKLTYRCEGNGEKNASIAYIINNILGRFTNE